ncbi:ferroportin1-like protein [Phanerochaete sordida]|uniref:Solute carrier family 40 member n=1 Tax=Phanerochaete sordida TaxID=48140 RepID=A0A9P3G5X1_9APHY|nr:ferroportin1-like protein [Phanerochaete sordida]
MICVPAVRVAADLSFCSALTATCRPISRSDEPQGKFGAVLFLAKIYPGTLFYASFYALVRAGSATLFSSWVGRYVDSSDRLRCVRASIIWQRVPVALSCLAFAALLLLQHAITPWPGRAIFAATALLACVEKLASIANTVSVERDWIVVVSEEINAEREDVNAVMRRIDLLAKLLAPVFVSAIDEYSTSIAIWTVFGQNAVSVITEYHAIAQVYRNVPGLSTRHWDTDVTGDYDTIITPSSGASDTDSERANTSPTPRSSLNSPTGALQILLRPWIVYFKSSAVLASLSLSILYLTVLSTGVQMQAYLLTLGFGPLEVSFMRFAAVLVELLATWAAPVLSRKIGHVRAALWFINEQLICVGVAVALYLAAYTTDARAAGLSLIGAVTFSRLGLWGFDLCVQFLVQEETSEHIRGQFSSTEMALQNLFELLSFATTVIFARPDQFKYPVIISTVAVSTSACLFAAFVRKRRGHLFHTSPCLSGEKYEKLSQCESRNEAGSESGLMWAEPIVDDGDDGRVDFASFAT